MYALPVGTIVEIRQTCRYDGQVCENTFYYELATAGVTDGSGAIASLILLFDTLWGGVINPLFVSDVTDIQVHGQSIFPNRFVELVIPSSVPAGLTAPPGLPTGVSLVMRRRGDAANRKSRGRIYIPGVPEAACLNSQFIAGFVNGFLIQWQVINGTLTAGGFDWNAVVFSLRDVAGKALITSTDMDLICRYQRRREIGVGI